MSKYTPQNVLKIKRDMERLSQEVSGLTNDKEKIQEEIALLKSEASDKRNLLSALDNSYAMKLVSYKEQVGIIAEEIERLNEMRERMIRVVRILSVRAEKEQDGSDTINSVAFAKSVITKITNELTHLEEKRDIELNNLDAIKRETEKYEEYFNQLSKSKEDGEKELLYLGSEIDEKRLKNQRLGKEYLRLEAKRKSILRREQSSIVYLSRIKELYKLLRREAKELDLIK